MSGTRVSGHSDDEVYTPSNSRPLRKRAKRRKVNNGQVIKVEEFAHTLTPSPELKPFVSLQPLLDLVGRQDPAKQTRGFEGLIENLLPGYIHERKLLQEKDVEVDIFGQSVRPMTRYEASRLVAEAESNGGKVQPSLPRTITLRKLKAIRQRGLANVLDPRISAPRSQSTYLMPLPRPVSVPIVKPVVLDALYSIKTTPYRHSFASRLHGLNGEMEGESKVIAVDWETRSPWMELMSDVREHYALAYPERDQPSERDTVISYTSLQCRHLPQVHDILARVFWTGIDVSDSLQYSPEKCTVVATYKRLVVGIAILSSPQETYITYLAVRAGWDNSQIATSMLYHLIQLNPNKDITLHVSVNNPAMLLYNRFGFKAEEFVAGFYEDYLDPQSRASKNAFRLRLRR